jgi:alpha-tubulin suppressor-like RCC1 family protein
MTNQFFYGITKSYIIFSSGSGTWTVPSDWNNSNNSIECIGAGGSTNYSNVGFGYLGGAGAGGGAYSRISNFSLTPGATIHYNVGSTSSSGSTSNTWFSTTSSSPVSTSEGVMAKSGGNDISGLSIGTGGSAASSIGTTKFNGGSGVNAGGGGGSGGPNGAGGDGSITGGGLADAGGKTSYKDATGKIYKLGNGGAIGQSGNNYNFNLLQYVTTAYGGGAGSSYKAGSTGTLEGEPGLIVIWYSALPTVGQNDYDIYLKNTVVSWDDLNALTAGNSYAWGYNDIGQLGIGSITPQSSPTLMGALTWKMLSTQNASTLGIQSDGTIWAWGDNTYGQLGTNFGTNYSSPIKIGTATSWKTAAMGSKSAVAVKTDGTLWFWGNTPTPMTLPAGNIVSTPVQIGSGTIWKYVSNGYYNGAAIQQDGSLWIWGDNSYGQIGNNTSGATPISSPIQVGGGPWKSVSCQYYSVYAIKTDGTMWGWGYNGNYDLGIGTNANSLAPRQITTDSNWSQVTGISDVGGSGVGIAIKTDGTIWSWGSDGRWGRTGQNNATQLYTSPAQIGTMANWQSVSIGETVAAIKTDGTLWTWGSNIYGQLGLGTNGNSVSSPVQVGSSTNWRSVSVATAGLNTGSAVATTWPSTFYNN